MTDELEVPLSRVDELEARAPRWPAWYPGLELGAVHLLGLEDYLLERSRIGEPLAGVAALDTGSLRVTSHEGAWSVRLPAVRGVTRGGQPVRVRPEDKIEGELPEVGTDGRVDVWVGVNPPGSTRDKLSLLLETADAAPTSWENEYDERLYLGRYRLEEARLALAERPLPLTLAALRPHDEAWQRWTAPIAERVHAALARTAVRVATEPRAIPAYSELALLAADWPLEPVARLAHRLARVNGLLEWCGSPQQEAPVALMVPGWSDEAIPGDDLPALLADLIGEAHAQVRPAPAPPTLTRIRADQMAELLLPIRLHVPLDKFRCWREVLMSGPERADAEVMLSALEQRANEGRLDNWSLAVGLMTLHALWRSGLAPPETLVARYAGRRGDVERELGRILGRLYREEAQSEPAGPLGYLALMQCASELSLPMESLQATARQYLHALSAGGTGRPPRGRVAEFLSARWLRSAPSARFPVPEVRGTGLPTQGSVGILVVGPKGSGKSTLVERWREDLGSALAPWALRMDDDTGDTPGETFSTRHGQLKASLQMFEVDVHELTLSVAGVLPALPAVHLVVLALDPSTLDRATPPEDVLRPLVELVSRIDNAYNPDTRLPPYFALCFTRADEYGTAEPDTLRIVPRGVPLAEGHADDWTQIVRGQKRSREIGDTAWQKTREIVVEQSALLWRAANARAPGGRCNGYFVASRSRDPCLRTASARGLEILIDFLEA